jgi:hypothetical protein
MGSDRPPHHRLRQGVRGFCQERCPGSTLGQCSWDRSAHRFGSGGGGRRGPELHARTRPGSLARPRAPAGNHGRSAEAARDQPTRQQVSAQAPGPRGTLGAAQPHQRRYTAWRWLTGLLARAHKNTVVVALANKLARIAWAVLVGERRFLSSPAMVSVPDEFSLNGAD